MCSLLSVFRGFEHKRKHCIQNLKSTLTHTDDTCFYFSCSHMNKLTHTKTKQKIKHTNTSTHKQIPHKYDPYLRHMCFWLGETTFHLRANSEKWLQYIRREREGSQWSRNEGFKSIHQKSCLRVKVNVLLFFCASDYAHECGWCVFAYVLLYVRASGLRACVRACVHAGMYNILHLFSHAK